MFVYFLVEIIAVFYQNLTKYVNTPRWQTAVCLNVVAFNKAVYVWLVCHTVATDTAV